LDPAKNLMMMNVMIVQKMVVVGHPLPPSSSLLCVHTRQVAVVAAAAMGVV